MTADEAAIRLRAVFRRHDDDGCDWLRTLDEFEEPPLFDRCKDVAFLSQLDAAERGIVLMRCAVEELDRAADFLGQLEGGDRYFTCLTVFDWDLVAEGAQTVPTPCLFVSPRADVELVETFECVRPFTAEGFAVERWVASLERKDLCVGETVSRDEDESLRRIYVGYVRGRSFKSLGEIMWTTEDPGLVR